MEAKLIILLDKKKTGVLIQIVVAEVLIPKPNCMVTSVYLMFSKVIFTTGVGEYKFKNEMESKYYNEATAISCI